MLLVVDVCGSVVGPAVVSTGSVVPVVPSVVVGAVVDSLAVPVPSLVVGVIAVDSESVLGSVIVVVSDGNVVVIIVPVAPIVVSPPPPQPPTKPQEAKIRTPEKRRITTLPRENGGKCR